MAKKRFRQQKKAIRKIWDGKSSVFILLFMAIIAFILILSSTENPEHWVEKDIVVSDISTVTGGTFYYQITDTTGATYSIDQSNKNVQKLVPGERYHIIHASIHWNRIKYMSDGNTVYVDYEESVDAHLARTIVGWVGILITSTLTLVMLWHTFKKIRTLTGKKC